MTLTNIVLICSLAAIAPTTLLPTAADTDEGDRARLRRMLIRNYDADESGDLSAEEWERAREELQAPGDRAEPRRRARATRSRDEDQVRGGNARRGRGTAGVPQRRGGHPSATRGTKSRRQAAGRRPYAATGAKKALVAQLHMSREEMLKFDKNDDGQLDEAERYELRVALQRRMEEARDKRFNAYIDRVLQGEPVLPEFSERGRRAARRPRFGRRGGPLWQHRPHRFGRDMRRDRADFSARRYPACEDRRLWHSPVDGPTAQEATGPAIRFR